MSLFGTSTILHDIREITPIYKCSINDCTFIQGNEHMERYLVEEWTQTKRELLREKGLWGPYLGSRFDKWMLDMTEGPCRMRKKMVANDIFFSHYPYRPDMENSVCINWRSKLNARFTY